MPLINLPHFSLRPLLVSSLLLVALLSSSVSLGRAAGGEAAARYQADETPSRLTAAEWTQVRASIEREQPASVTAQTMAQQAYLKASNTGALDYFGYTVAMSGNTLAVGAFFEASNAGGVNPPGGQADNSAPASGAVYIFTRNSGGGWSQQAYLKASNTGMNDWFGYTVALSGDTLAVGAPAEASRAAGVGGNQGDNSAPGAGAVYVFTRNSGGVWSQQAYVKASNTEAGDRFGYAVALSGDTLAVGAGSEDSSAGGVNPPGGQADNSASAAGAVYVFTRTSGVWSQQAYVKASNADMNDGFGYAVALSGDTLAVGAQGEASNATGVGGNQGDNSTPGTGAVYVFTRTGGGVWSQQAYVKASNKGGEFGAAVALSGDTLAVGAWAEASSAVGVNPPGGQADTSASEAGAVYVFTRSGGVWSQQAYLKASNTETEDHFGLAVALSGDILAVGAEGEASNAVGINPPGGQADNSYYRAGAVYMFIRSGGMWSQQAYIKASNTGNSDYFGYTVALSDDTLVVGAFSESSSAVGVNPPGGQADNSASAAGATYVFTGFGPPASNPPESKIYLPLVVK